MPCVKLVRNASLAAVALAVVPASAGAATLAVDKACYREGANAVATGGGFTPNAQVRFTLDGQDFTDDGNIPSADAAGNLNAGFGIGSPPGRQKTYTLGASDGTNTGETTFTATDLDVLVKPKRGNPGKRKRVRARGFDQGRVLRFHVRGPRRRNGRIGRLRGPCGKINKRVRIFRATYPTGVYTVQFDQRRRYRAGTNPRVVFQVTIFRVARPSVSGAAFSAGETWTPLD
jgi:hypothetical protein